MFGIFLMALYLVVAIPHNAHAYLDPASGNALVSSLIALAGTSLYMGKSLLYKIINRQTTSPPSSSTQLSEKDQSLVVFSEGKTCLASDLVGQKRGMN